MSSQRKEIRRAAVAALSNGGNQPFPTIAGAQVFDSKMTALQNVVGDSQLPSLLVYTDNEDGRPIQMNAWPMEWTVELVIELALGADSAEVATDAELEAQLDDLEEQVRDTLFNTTASEMARSFVKVFKKIVGYKSLRMSNAENNHRVAMRGIVISLTYTSACKSFADAFPMLEGIAMKVATGDENSPPVVATAAEV